MLDEQNYIDDKNEQVCLERIADLEQEITRLNNTIRLWSKRALHAETEWATFRQLTEQAEEIVKAAYPDWLKNVHPRVVHFLQRSADALKHPSTLQRD